MMRRSIFLHAVVIYFLFSISVTTAASHVQVPAEWFLALTEPLTARLESELPAALLTQSQAYNIRTSWNITRTPYVQCLQSVNPACTVLTRKEVRRVVKFISGGPRLILYFDAQFLEQKLELRGASADSLGGGVRAEERTGFGAAEGELHLSFPDMLRLFGAKTQGVAEGTLKLFVEVGTHQKSELEPLFRATTAERWHQRLQLVAQGDILDSAQAPAAAATRPVAASEEFLKTEVVFDEEQSSPKKLNKGENLAKPQSGPRISSETTTFPGREPSFCDRADEVNARLLVQHAQESDQLLEDGHEVRIGFTPPAAAASGGDSATGAIPAPTSSEDVSTPTWRSLSFGTHRLIRGTYFVLSFEANPLTWRKAVKRILFCRLSRIDGGRGLLLPFAIGTPTATATAEQTRREVASSKSFAIARFQQVPESAIPACHMLDSMSGFSPQLLQLFRSFGHDLQMPEWNFFSLLAGRVFADHSRKQQRAPELNFQAHVDETVRSFSSMYRLPTEHVREQFLDARKSQDDIRGFLSAIHEYVSTVTNACLGATKEYGPFEYVYTPFSTLEWKKDPMWSYFVPTVDLKFEAALFDHEKRTAPPGEAAAANSNMDIARLFYDAATDVPRGFGSDHQGLFRKMSQVRHSVNTTMANAAFRFFAVFRDCGVQQEGAAAGTVMKSGGGAGPSRTGGTARPVPLVALSTVINTMYGDKHHLDFELLKIDAQGFDWQVFQSVGDGGLRPNRVVMEAQDVSDDSLVSLYASSGTGSDARAGEWDTPLARMKRGMKHTYGYTRPPQCSIQNCILAEVNCLWTLYSIDADGAPPCHRSRTPRGRGSARRCLCPFQLRNFDFAFVVFKSEAYL